MRLRILFIAVGIFCITTIPIIAFIVVGHNTKSIARSERITLTNNQDKTLQQPPTPTPKTITTQSPPTQSITAQPSKTITTTPANPTPKNTTSQPAFGQDPQHPNIYKVFNTTAVMTSAGIAPDQQAAANQVIIGLSDWQYESTSNSILNLCLANPPIKMQSFGADYLTNPITQLKWCNAYVSSRYGSWNTALSHAQQNHGQI